MFGSVHSLRYSPGEERLREQEELLKPLGWELLSPFIKHLGSSFSKRSVTSKNRTPPFNHKVSTLIRFELASSVRVIQEACSARFFLVLTGFHGH